jgi:hypothetical protein
VIPFFKPGTGGKFKAGGPQAPVLYGAERLNGHKAAALVVRESQGLVASFKLFLHDSVFLDQIGPGLD